MPSDPLDHVPSRILRTCAVCGERTPTRELPIDVNDAAHIGDRVRKLAFCYEHDPEDVPQRPFETVHERNYGGERAPVETLLRVARELAGRRGVRG